MEWVTCENTYEETWRRLLEFANLDLAVEAITRIHGNPKNKGEKANYKKQAEQARVSLLQAKEYFEAARNSSLFTQPNHLYYGAVALSSACMLIRGDGSRALDFLRRQNENASHGLEFKFRSNLNESKKGLNLLENTTVKIHQNGHFANWYTTLASTQVVPAIIKSRNKAGSYTSMEVGGTFDLVKFDEIIGLKKDLSFLIKRLPDLHADLARFGVSVSSARGEHVISRNEISGQEQSSFFFHHFPSSTALEELVDCFSCETGVYFQYNIDESQKSGIITTRSDKKWVFSYPDSRTTLDHRTIFFSDILGTPEVADLFLTSYALSMLSRYYPDIWISFLESHCKGAKIVERVVRVLSLKMPNLILNQITNSELVISTHRPPWY